MNEQYVDIYHGHILTGNLAVVKNDELRTLMSKGAKFRESPRVKYNQIEESLLEDVESYCKKWCSKERLANFEGQIESWKNKVNQRIKDRLLTVKIQWPNLNYSIVLDKVDVKQELARLQEQYVITVVDKASNNFALQ